MNIPGLILTDDTIIFQFPFDLKKIEQAKEIGMKWAPAAKHWHMPRNMLNERIFQIQFGNGFDQTDKVRDVILEACGNYVPHPLLMKHQLEDIKLAMKKERHLFANDTGTGKTFCGIELIKLRDIKTLVVCPLSIIMAAWFEDLDKFRPELTKVNLWQYWKRHVRFYQKALSQHQICIVNFEGFKTQKRHLAGAKFEQVLIDESSKIKGIKSIVTKELTEFCDNIRYVYLFSGTPAPNNDLEYFSQMRIIDPTLFGKSYYRFRNKYFFNPGQGFKWIPQSDKRQDFLERLSKAMTVVKKENVLDLPEKTYRIREVTLSKDELKAYNEMAKTLVAEIENEEITAHNAAVKIMKLRQVTAGFMINHEGVPIKIGTSKLNELMDLLEEIGNKQVLIWTQFQYEADQIIKTLAPEQHRLMHTQKLETLWQHKGLKCGLCNGTIPQSMKEVFIQMFKDGKLQYMIAHPRSLGHGVTLTNCHYSIKYTISYSSEEETQSDDRIYRKGQHNACSYFYLLAPKTIDYVVYNALKGKIKMAKAVHDYIKGVHHARKVWEGI
uniref:Putative helicase n=1 Tax=viral metagenome TaxID=1070528 RepID=A0A6M3K845_9ZZZZ